MNVDISLLSHTNAGKTTIARTLLRQDIGEVADRPHVTELAESHVLIESGAGDALVLWDTPGFGDSARLLRRLRSAGNPFGWFLTQVWDRVTDRPFWCSQQAMRNARESSDVVLYVANAAEDPAAVGYVDAELEILGWIGKPILVLLNQLGTSPSPERVRADLDPMGRARFEAQSPSAACCPSTPSRVAGFRKARSSRRSSAAFPKAIARRSRDCAKPGECATSRCSRDPCRCIAKQLARVATDSEQLVERNVQEKARSWLAEVATGVQR